MISEENEQDIHFAPDFLQMQAVKNECTKLIQENVNISNCVGIFMMAELYHCQELKMYAKKFIKTKFSRVDEFLNLNCKQLINFISCSSYPYGINK